MSTTTETVSLPQIDLALCHACGACVRACPSGALALIDGAARLVRPDNCDYCGACEEACPHNAIACPYEIILLPPDG